MIEHRHGTRFSIEKEVSIYHRGTLVAECRIKDISMEGMSIWSGPMKYHRNTVLEMEFGSDGNTKIDKLKQQALVVHSSMDVLGLMFIDMENENRKELSLMLSQGNVTKPQATKVEGDNPWGEDKLISQTV